MRFWKTPFEQDQETVWKGSDPECGSHYIVYSTTHSKWFVMDSKGNVIAHILSKLCQWGEDIIAMPLGDLVYPAWDVNEQQKHKMSVMNPAKLQLKRKPEVEQVEPPLMPQKAKAIPAVVPPPAKAPPIPAPGSKPADPSLSGKPVHGSVWREVYGQKRPAVPVHEGEGSSSSGQAASAEGVVPPVPGPPVKRARHGWFEKCGELIIYYKKRNWNKCDRLVQQYYVCMLYKFFISFVFSSFCKLS